MGTGRASACRTQFKAPIKSRSDWSKSAETGSFQGREGEDRQCKCRDLERERDGGAGFFADMSKLGLSREDAMDRVKWRRAIGPRTG